MRPCLMLVGVALAACGGEPMISNPESVLPDGAVPDPTAAPDSSSSTLTAAPGENVSISEIAIFQTLKVTIAKNGTPASSTIPIVADKESLMRVYVHLEPGWQMHNIVGVLDITAGGQSRQFKDVLSPAMDSTDETLTSTFNFKLTAELIASDTTFTMQILEQAVTAMPASDPLPSRYPMDLTPAAIKTQKVGKQLRVVLVPMRYKPDGSARLPDTSPAQLDVYKNFFYSMYPAPKVEITVRAPVDVNTAITAGGAGWGAAINTIINTRQTDGAAYDAYYYGIFNPAATLSTFCPSACVKGLSMVAAQPTDAIARAGVGLGYSGGDPGWSTVSVAAHEIGHQHGREHAPCGGAAGADPSYPHPQGATNTIGYALTDIGIATQGSILMPTSGSTTLRDIMGYCHPKWISDYTYKALFTRMKIINGAAIVPGPSVGYRWSMVDEQWNITQTGPRFTHDMPPGGEPRTINGKSGWFYPYDHIGGGMFLQPD